MYFNVQQRYDLPRRPSYLEFSLGLLVGNLAGGEFDLKDEFHVTLVNIRKTPLICICSLKPSQHFFFFLLSHFPRMSSEPDVQKTIWFCALC